MFQNSIKKLDSLILKLEQDLNVPPSSIDPTDPWAHTATYVSPLISKNKCSCGYLSTLPFEEHCPMCFFKNKANLKPQFSLPPVEEILKRLKNSTSGEPASKKAKVEATEATKSGAESKGQSGDSKKVKGSGGNNNSSSGSANPPSHEENFSKALLKVSKILSVKKHPESEKLYICEVDVGGEKRTVCAGLQAFFTPQDLENRLVVTILNLKPRKIANVISQAMILAGENVKAVTLQPPPNSQPGDQLFLQGGSASKTTAKELSSKIWGEIAPLLNVQEGKATFNGKVLVTEKGEVQVPNLPDGSTIK